MITILVTDKQYLKKVIDSIKKVDGITSVRRKFKSG